jgi:hypothetical protein
MTVSFVSASGSNQSQLYLGTNNNINVNTIEVGQRKANGLIAFRGGVTDGVLTLRSQTGGRATWNIGAHATNDGTGTAGQGTVDLTADTVGGTRGGGTIDALVGTLLIGRSNNSTGNGTDASPMTREPSTRPRSSSPKTAPAPPSGAARSRSREPAT